MKRKSRATEDGCQKRCRTHGGVRDPSLQYIKAPLKAPMVTTARKFFREHSPASGGFEVVCGALDGWRTVAKLAVRGSRDGFITRGGSIGLFAPGSHNIVPCFESPVQHASINQAAVMVEQACVASKTTGYREATAIGLLRYLLLAVETSSNKVQLVLVVNCDPSDVQESDRKMMEKLVETIWDRASTLLLSLWIHFHPAGRHDNAITGRLDGSWKLVKGTEDLSVRILEGDDGPPNPPPLYFPPNVFRQANLGGFGNIIRSMRRFVPKKSRVIELYGGVGTIGLNLYDLVKRLQCSDENPYNKECFNKSLEILCEESGKRRYRKRINYITSSASERADSGDLTSGEYKILIVDPPRKGLDEEVVQQLIITGSTAIERVLYVSCGFKAFQRDCQRLTGSGRWVLTHAEGHVLFPGADHIETFAVFDKK